MPAGRPTKYRKEYCDLIIRHFDIPATTTKKQTIVTRSVVKTIDVEVPNMVPTIESFARKLGVMTETIVAWTKEYPEFLKRIALSLILDFLIVPIKFIISNMISMFNWSF